MYFMYYVKDLFPGKDVIISYRNAILRIMLRPFQISVVLALVENIWRRQCEQEEKHVSWNWSFEIAHVTFCWC
jgi:hypothetical protein